MPSLLNIRTSLQALRRYLPGLALRPYLVGLALLLLGLGLTAGLRGFGTQGGVLLLLISSTLLFAVSLLADLVPATLPIVVVAKPVVTRPVVTRPAVTLATSSTALIAIPTKTAISDLAPASPGNGAPAASAAPPRDRALLSLTLGDLLLDAIGNDPEESGQLMARAIQRALHPEGTAPPAPGKRP